MKGIVVFDTSYGNTRKIGEVIAETLLEAGIEADTRYVKEVKKLSTRDYSFLVLGSPTRFGTMSLAVRGFLGKVNHEEWLNKPFAAFDTQNPENIAKDQGCAAEKIAEKLRAKQMNQTLPVLKAVVFGAKGPLQAGEIEKTREYARRLAIALMEDRVPYEAKTAVAV